MSYAFHTAGSLREMDHAMLIDAPRGEDLTARHRLVRDQGLTWSHGLLREQGLTVASARRRAEILYLCGLGLTVSLGARAGEGSDGEVRALIDRVVEFVSAAHDPRDLQA